MEAFLKTGKLGAGPTGKSSVKALEKRRGPIPWVEKYRPRSIEDVVYQDEVVSVLRKTLDGADLPNLLFYGPPGTGKTSTILAVARELFGEIYKERVLELNASDERGIQIVRGKVKSFAQTAVSATRPNGQPCPPYKIIILDESDSMTSAAQAALRRTMEKQSKTTRFCLLCNYVSRIIDPLTSRCSKFRFKPLSEGVMLKHLSYICQEENVQYENNVLESLINSCEGDLRKAITLLQSLARLKSGDTLVAMDVLEVSGVIEESTVLKFLETCKKKSYDSIEKFVHDFVLAGYSAMQLITQLHDEIIRSQEFSDVQKSQILLKISECDERLHDGADEYLQIMDLAGTIIKHCPV